MLNCWLAVHLQTWFKNQLASKYLKIRLQKKKSDFSDLSLNQTISNSGNQNFMTQKGNTFVSKYFFFQHLLDIKDSIKNPKKNLSRFKTIRKILGIILYIYIYIYI